MGFTAEVCFLPERMHVVGAEPEKLPQKPSVEPMACSSQALVWEREAKLMRKSLQGLGPWLGPEHRSCATARQMALVSFLLMGLRKTERISPLHSLIGQLLWRVGGMFWGTLCEDVLL